MKTNVLIALALALVLSGCGSTKRIKTENTATTQTTTAVTTTKTVDTTVRIKGDTATASKPASNVLAGKPLTVNTPTQKIHVSYNPTTENLEVQGITLDQVVPVKQTETTTATTDATTTTEAKANEKTEQGRYVWLLYILVVFAVSILITLLLAYIAFRVKSRSL